MLTKEERKAIAERIGKEFDYTENDEVYEALIGEEIPDNTTWGTDCKVVRNRLIELCDTSNMVELPLDKVVLIHRPSRTVCLDMVDGSDNGVVSLSEGSIDKLIDSIPVRDKPAKPVTVRTRLL